jgi:hypothetical protein
MQQNTSQLPTLTLFDVWMASPPCQHSWESNINRSPSPENTMLTNEEEDKIEL